MLSEDQSGIYSKVTAAHDDWRALLIESNNQIDHFLLKTCRVAVVGIKTPEAGGPAYSVPAWLQQVGYRIVPVPVYYPEVTRILGEPVHRSLATVAPAADMVLIFRKSADVLRHVDEILAAMPRLVWMQLGIRNDTAAERFAKAGIAVVQDRCIQQELTSRPQPAGD